MRKNPANKLPIRSAPKSSQSQNVFLANIPRIAARSVGSPVSAEVSGLVGSGAATLNSQLFSEVAISSYRALRQQKVANCEILQTGNIKDAKCVSWRAHHRFSV